MSAGGSFLQPSGDEPQGRLSFFDELPADVRAAVQFREDEGDYTAERLFAQHPRIYQACVRLLGMGMPAIAIAEVLSMSEHTVRGVESREEGSVAEVRGKQGKRRRQIMSQILDLMPEKLKDASAKDCAIVYGVFDDKERLDSGSPTQIHGTVAPKPANDVMADWLKESGIVLEAEVVPPTGLEGGRSLQMGGDGARPADGDRGQDEGTSPGARDT